jgi:hypothetical protein
LPWADAWDNQVYLVVWFIGWEDELLTKHAPNGEAVEAEVVALPIHATTTEEQAAGALNITTVDGT